MTSAADLFGLQEIDLNRDNRRALIADLESRVGETEELVAARAAVGTAQAQVEVLARRQRDIEARLADLEAKIRPFEAKLYGGSIRNPKELVDLQHEVESLKKQRGKIDDEGLSNIDAAEAAAAVLATARRTLAEVEAAWRNDQQEIADAHQRALLELAQLEEERNRRAVRMDADRLRLYETLRAVRQGRPVARIERGACQGCRLSLPTHVIQRARSALNLVQCPSCERILLAG